MKKILLAHGGGGEETRGLINGIFRKELSNPILNGMEDAALLSFDYAKIAFTTDSFIVDPPFFPGGNIGNLAVAGTVNDLSVMGARPRYLSAGFILGEGFRLSDLKKIVTAMAEEAEVAGVKVVTGDTKVMPGADFSGIAINTAGLGEVVREGLSASNLCPGDTLILSGTVGDHGACILAAREGIDFQLSIESDCASLWPMLKGILSSHPDLHALRDPTRGGLAGVLTEWAEASSATIEIDEEKIPIQDAVRGTCELLGMDPLHFACEGRAVIAAAGNGDAILAKLRDHPLGRKAVIIGRVVSKDRPRVILKTSWNTRRILDPPSGELLPRIC
ncbi:MAG: hydrogenase expression/formation protein HypE [Deltaproteobacteria bacterium]|nr:hydrogenase expression/formation protein HypE [Deltaproteobacteria bacterium]